MLYSKIPINKDVRRFDDKAGNRFYYFKENGRTIIASGITTIFHSLIPEGKELYEWKERNKNWRDLFKWSADYGTIEHDVFADIMLGNGVSKDKVSQMISLISLAGGSTNTPPKDILAFLKWMEDTDIEPVIIEGILPYSFKGEYLCMTIDLLAYIKVKVKEKTVIKEGVYLRGAKKGQPKFKEVTEVTEKKILANIDFKSNFFEKDRKSYFEGHKMQLIGASRAVEQNFGLKVDEVYNWSPNNWRDEPGYTFFKHEITKEDNENFDAYLTIGFNKGLHKPKGSILKTNFKKSNDFEFLGYKDYAEILLNQK